MNQPIRIVQYGLGPIGLGCVRVLARKQASGQVALVGAIDIDPEKAGRSVSEVTGVSLPGEVMVSADAEAALAELRPDVVLHTTSSFLDRVHDQLLLCVRAGAHVVSSTEELSYPFERDARRAAEVNDAARAAGVVVVGTGVNPGYAMDALALTATGVCVDVQTVRVERVVDAGRRRLPLQRKVGAGITPELFEERKRTGTFGHIGLIESLLLVARGLGWPLDEVNETLEPVLADAPVTTPYLSVEGGQVAGIHHVVTGRRGGRTVLSLDLKMYVGASDPRDSVFVDGDPPIDLEVRGGIFGDTATVGALVNTIPLAMRAEPGLRTVEELPLPRAFATGAPTTP